MGAEIEVDYLIVGAGAAGMAMADELLTHTDATLAIVDRRAAPGGHWREAYPFVRLHQPSTYYGVSSTPMGGDTIDSIGINKGFYELAGADEICAYYDRVMSTRMLPTGRVHYFPNSDYREDGTFVSRLSGKSQAVEFRRKRVDARYVEGRFPASCPPPFEVAADVRCIPAGEIANLPEAPERYVIIGAGKTALDVCVFLLDRGVAPDQIQWIKSREARWLNRRFQQSHTLLPDMYRGSAMQIVAMAQASSIEDLFERLEADEVFLRVDPSTPATALRGAVVSETELALLRQIEDVVRLGHVQRIERDAIVLTEGRVPTTPGTVHVHCAARGLPKVEHRPIFAPNLITMQPVQWSFACYQLAMLGAVEAMLEDDESKNRLCRPIDYWDTDADYLRAFLRTMTIDRAAMNHPELQTWMRTTRLNPASGLGPYLEHPEVVRARGLVKEHAPAAAQNLMRMLGEG